MTISLTKMDWLEKQSKEYLEKLLALRKERAATPVLSENAKSEIEFIEQLLESGIPQNPQPQPQPKAKADSTNSH